MESQNQSPTPPQDRPQSQLIVPEPATETPVNPATNQTPPPTPKCKHLPIIIVLAVVATGALAFGGLELSQNISLNKENEELRLASQESAKNNAQKEKQESEKILEYKYTDEATPPTTYKIKLNFDTKELYAYEYESCSAVDCEGSESANTVILTDNEIEKIRTITETAGYNKGHLSSALCSLVLDTKIFTTADEEEGSYEAEYDLDGDGTITYREFGNKFLNSIIEDLNDS